MTTIDHAALLHDCDAERVGQQTCLVVEAAPSLALALGGDLATFVKKLSDIPRDLVLLASRETDENGQLWNLHAPLCRYGNKEETAAFVAALKGTQRRLVLDTCYDTRDEEYRDACLLE